MKLHNNTAAFESLVHIVSDYYKIEAALIEKDYYVTLILKELAVRVENLIFKGGTSLSKCYKIIDRFSEDIDLSLDENYRSQSQKKHMKKELVAACETLGLKLINLEETRSRRDYNCYKIEYPINNPSPSIKPLLLVETTYITKAFPTETRNATSIIYDYLKETGNEEAIKKYMLEPFEIKVQALDRTLIDKTFALCDYAFSGKFERNSRHIYDLSRLLSKVKLDESFKELVKCVREDRRNNAACYSAQDGFDVSGTLAKIIDLNLYRADYEAITSAMLYKSVSYDEAINALQTIIESKAFD